MIFIDMIIRMPRFKILKLILVQHIFCLFRMKYNLKRRLHKHVFGESVAHCTDGDARFTNASLSAGDVQARVVTLAISYTPNSRCSNVAISSAGISVFWDTRRISISSTLSLPVFNYTFFSYTDYSLNLQLAGVFFILYDDEWSVCNRYKLWNCFIERGI